MQFTTLIATFTIVASAWAGTIKLDNGGGTLETRTASKLNQYPQPNCLDNSGGNTPTYHASPPAHKCYNIDSTTVSFYQVGGPNANIWTYSEAGCNGLSVNVAGRANCQAVYVDYSNEFQNVMSIMMD